MVQHIENALYSALLYFFVHFGRSEMFSRETVQTDLSSNYGLAFTRIRVAIVYIITFEALYLIIFS